MGSQISSPPKKNFYFKAISLFFVGVSRMNAITGAFSGLTNAVKKATGTNNSKNSANANKVANNTAAAPPAAPPAAAAPAAVGGRRRNTRKNRRRGTRKNRKARRGTRKYGGAKPTNYSNCEHIYEESHDFPSLLIEIKRKNNNSKKPGPSPPWRFYDCEEEKDKQGKLIYRGRSCDNPSYDGMPIKPEDITEKGTATKVKEIVDWCCPK